MKLGLGTVQFGLDYGIANAAGKPPETEVAAILEAARRAGIDVLDTAAAYGDSEDVLGRLAGPASGFRVISKTPADGPLTPARLEEGLARSLQRLRRERLDGLLVHRADDLLGPQGEALVAALQSCKARGLVARIGVSVYTGEQIDALLARCEPDIVQAPVSMLDQRLVRSGRLAALKRRGIEVHARSAFLQGLLFMDPATLPPHFDSERARLAAVRERLARAGATPAAAALAWLRETGLVDVAICGVDSPAQLAELCAAAESALPDIDFAACALDDERVLDPSQWRFG